MNGEKGVAACDEYSFGDRSECNIYVEVLFDAPDAPSRPILVTVKAKGQMLLKKDD